jgi:long-chain acyl-CoA synthetase
MSNASHGASVRSRSEKILLTGATGFLGRHILCSILPRLGEQGAVYCLIRAASPAEASCRLAEVLANGPAASLAPRVKARCRAIWGDVTHEGLVLDKGRDADVLANLDRVIHCAAEVKFNLPLDRARQVNVEGTRNVLRLATALEQAGRLRRVDYIGTAFVAGDAHGLVFEEPLLGRLRFHNSYERSKWEAESVVRQYQQDLPLTIYRPSIVVGDSRTGYTTSFRMLYWPLKLLASGTVPFAPVDEGGLLDVVPVDFVVEAFNALADCETSLGKCYHLAAGPAGQSALGDLLATAAEFFAVSKPSVIPPQLAFGLLRPVLNAVLWGKRREMLAKAESYLPYFAYHASFDTSMATSELEPLGIRPPQVVDYFRNLLRYSLDSDWGRRPPAAGRVSAKPARPAVAPKPPAVSPPPAATLFARLTSVLELFTKRMDPSDPANRDPVFIRMVAPPLDFIGRWYFRAEGEDTENLPASGAFIAVGNHNGGPLLPDEWMLLAYAATVVGAERPTYALVHDFGFRIPLVNNFLMKIGCLRARPANAAKALALGAGVLIYPGGELDAFRSFWKRNTIDFHGRTGFIQLSYRLGVPIVPIVNIGGHEVYLTVFSSRWLAQWSGIEWLTGIKTVPLTIGLPWGIWLTGFLPYLPLPSKFVYKVGAPIDLEPDPALADDAEAVGHTYHRVIGVMQDMLDDLARRRRFPVLG